MESKQAHSQCKCLTEEADHYRGVNVGLYLIQQVRENYKGINADSLLDALFSASSDGQRNIYIVKAPHVASLLFGTAVGDKGQTEALADLASQLERHGNQDAASALRQFIRVSQNSQS